MSSINLQQKIIIGILASLFLLAVLKPGNADPQELATSTKTIRKARKELEQSATKRVKPTTPPLARSSRLGGMVFVEVTVDEQGDVISAQVIDGEALVDNAALEAARGWKFAPTSVDGTPARVTGILKFEFGEADVFDVEELEGKTENLQGKSELADHYYALAQAYTYDDRHQDAVEAYRQAIKLEPDSPVGYYGLGEAYSDLKKHEKAAEAYKEAIRIKPDYYDASSGLAMSYWRLGRPEEAIATLKEAMRVDPSLGVKMVALSGIALIYKDIGRYEESVDTLGQLLNIKMQLLSIDPEIPGLSPDIVANEMAELYGKMGRYEEAIEAYKRAITVQLDLKKGDPETDAWVNQEQTLFSYHNIGLNYEKLGRNKEAIEAYRKALELRPDYVKARFDLASLYLKLGDKQSAVKEYEALKGIDEKAAAKLLSKIGSK